MHPVVPTTVAEAFAALDAISAKMMRTGTPSNAIELVVVDENGRQWSGLIATSRLPVTYPWTTTHDEPAAASRAMQLRTGSPISVRSSIRYSGWVIGSEDDIHDAA